MLGRWLRDWDVFLAIMAVGILTGLIVFMAADSHPAGCHHILDGRPVLAWLCSHP